MSKEIFVLIALSCFFVAIPFGVTFVAADTFTIIIGVNTTGGSYSFAGASTPASNTTQIQVGYYYDNKCTIVQFESNHTAGQCIYDSSQYFSDSTNGYVYQYLFDGYGCPIANISTIMKIQVGICGATSSDGSFFTMFKIFPSNLNPAAPTSFPPTGFLTTTEYLNLTTSKPADTCDTAHTISYAFPTPANVGCSNNGDGTSARIFFDSTCTTEVTAIYSDLSCTNVVAVEAQMVEFKSCIFGTPVTCPGTALPSFPNTLTIGLTLFDNNQCLTNSKTMRSVLTSGGCLDGSSVTCGMVNGTQMLISNHYSNVDCTGAIISTKYLPTGVCSQDVNHPNITGTCNAGPIAPILAASSSTGGIDWNSSSTGGIDWNSVEPTRSISIGSILLPMVLGWTITYYASAA